MKNDHGDRISVLQDKYRVKEIVGSSGLLVAQLLFVTDDPTTIPFDSLPGDFFLKANHGCGWNVIQRDGRLFRFGDGRYLLDKAGKFLPPDEVLPFVISRSECIRQCQKWLRTKYSRKEPSYHRILPRILIEERLLPSNPEDELRDYRFYTFNGRVRVISVGSPSYRFSGVNIFFTPAWEEIPLTVYAEKRPEILPPRPVRLAEMITHAERLGDGINFVRVDLYDTSKGVAFGELTFYPQAGGNGTPTNCTRFNQWLGSFWEIGAR